MDQIRGVGASLPSCSLTGAGCKLCDALVHGRQREVLRAVGEQARPLAAAQKAGAKACPPSPMPVSHWYVSFASRPLASLSPGSALFERLVELTTRGATDANENCASWARRGEEAGERGKQALRRGSLSLSCAVCCCACWSLREHAAPLFSCLY